MTWGKFIIAAWGVVLALSLMTSALPASWWFEPGAVRVSDARRGVCAKMDFDREINRPFFGTWKVTVMRKSSGGSWYTFRIFSEENDYRPDNSLPEDLNICWWIWEDSIDPPLANIASTRFGGSFQQPEVCARSGAPATHLR